MCIFSVGKLFCTCGAGDDAAYVRFGETKYKYFNRSLRHGTEMRHRNLRSDSVPNRFHRYRCHVGTGFRYATLTVRERDATSLQARNTDSERLLSAASLVSNEKRKVWLLLVTVMIEIAKWISKSTTECYVF